MPEHIHMREGNLNIWAWFTSMPLKVQTSHIFYICWNLAEQELRAFYCCQSPRVLDYAVVSLYVRDWIYICRWIFVWKHKTHSSSVGRLCLSYFGSCENLSLNHFNTSEVQRLSSLETESNPLISVEALDVQHSSGVASVGRKNPATQENPLNFRNQTSPRGREAFKCSFKNLTKGTGWAKCLFNTSWGLEASFLKQHKWQHLVHFDLWPFEISETFSHPPLLNSSVPTKCMAIRETSSSSITRRHCSGLATRGL